METGCINNIPESARINDKKIWIVGKIPTVTVTDLQEYRVHYYNVVYVI